MLESYFTESKTNILYYATNTRHIQLTSEPFLVVEITISTCSNKNKNFTFPVWNNR